MITPILCLIVWCVHKPITSAHAPAVFPFSLTGRALARTPPPSAARTPPPPAARADCSRAPGAPCGGRPIVIPLVCLALVVACRDAIRKGESSDLSKATQFLHFEYRKEVYFWESCSLFQVRGT